MDLLNDTAEYAYAHRAVVAVENMISSCLGNSAQEFFEIISVNDKLHVCFDDFYSAAQQMADGKNPVIY